MTRFSPPKSHRIPVREPEESEGAPIHTEPDKGLLLATIPEVPAQKRAIDPP